MQTAYDADVRSLDTRDEAGFIVGAFLCGFLLVCGVASILAWTPLVEAASYAGLSRAVVVATGFLDIVLAALVVMKGAAFYAALVSGLVSLAATWLSLKYDASPIAMIPAITFVLSVALIALRFDFARVQLRAPTVR
jgi:hypothetical protein